MGFKPILRNLCTSGERRVLSWAHSEGFQWCYEYLGGKPQSLLTSLGLGVLLHCLMPSRLFKQWRSEVWVRSPAVAKVLKGCQLSRVDLYDTEEFWRELTERVRTAAVEVCRAQGDSETALALDSAQCTAAHIERALEPLCQALSLELYIFGFDGQRQRKIRSYNSGSERVRCYVVVAEDDGSFHYLLHQRFHSKVAVDMEGRFPFKTSGRAKLWTADTDEEELVLAAALLKLVRAPRLDLTLAAEEYGECVAACQRYARYRDSQSLPPIDLQIPDLSTMKLCGPHGLQHCERYDMGERYIRLHCQHLFHHKCVLAHLATVFYSKRDSGHPVQLQCPACSTELVGSDLDYVSASFRRDVEEHSASYSPQQYKVCHACKFTRDSRLVISHCARHDVCAGCLRTLNCPICTHPLTPADEEFVRRCFE